MKTLTRYQNPASALWQPVVPLFGLGNTLDRLFEHSLREFPFGNELLRSWNPAVDLYEDRDNVTVKAELPGMNKQDIQVSLENGILSISGERKGETQQDGKHGHRLERFVGAFQRSVTLPADVKADKVEAQYKDGVLTITLPKSEATKAKHIEVKVS